MWSHYQLGLYTGQRVQVRPRLRHEHQPSRDATTSQAVSGVPPQNRADVAGSLASDVSLGVRTVQVVEADVRVVELDL